MQHDTAKIRTIRVVSFTNKNIAIPHNSISHPSIVNIKCLFFIFSATLSITSGS